MEQKSSYRILISGGGTGGHIFPALSIANALRRRCPDIEILFVGAEGRMEMERVPAAGYRIIGLPVCGFDRKRLWRNVKVLWKLRKSMSIARKVLKEFSPDIAVGVGGYASGPILKAAQAAGIPTLLQEQNSYAGVTNKILASKATDICVAYSGMERFFPAGKIVMTGNPVRSSLLELGHTQEDAKKAPAVRRTLNPDDATASGNRDFDTIVLDGPSMWSNIIADVTPGIGSSRAGYMSTSMTSSANESASPNSRAKSLVREYRCGWNATVSGLSGYRAFTDSMLWRSSSGW